MATNVAAAVPLLWDEDDEGLSQECKDLIANSPAEPHLLMNKLYQYQGFWLSKRIMQAILNCQHHFQALDSDIILVTSPKSGSTWFKALTFAILNRKTHHPNPTRMSSTTHPLLTSSPHALVRTMETTLYNGQPEPDLSMFSSPRLFSTHMPYVLLPESIKSSRCKIVYLCRNPKDQFVSSWHFMNKLRPEIQEDNAIADSFEQFCRGVSPWGPFWDHRLAYYKESLEKPNKIMFVKYEDMKSEPDRVLKDLAGFMEYGFSNKEEEEEEDIVSDILKLCSFENLSNLEVNKSGKSPHGIEHSAFFRRGNVGDWKNFLESDMTERIDVVIQEKLEKHGLKF